MTRRSGKGLRIKDSWLGSWLDRLLPQSSQSSQLDIADALQQTDEIPATYPVGGHHSGQAPADDLPGVQLRTTVPATQGVAITAVPEAAFGVDLALPNPASAPHQAAAAAIDQEYRDAYLTKRLRCRTVSVIAQSGRDVIYAIHTGRSVSFDWTWEGAVAFRPADLAEHSTHANGPRMPAATAEVVWAGEILEVDESTGCLFVALRDPENPPVSGTFFVRPFDFLGALHAIYHQASFEPLIPRLNRRLAASEGGHYPLVTTGDSCDESSLPYLRECWQHSWGILWGPPGSGKTWNAGKQIARVALACDERILVVSTTNRATDAIALSIGRAVLEAGDDGLQSGAFVRVGRGAARATFKSCGLSAMLQDAAVTVETSAPPADLTVAEKAQKRAEYARLQGLTPDQSRQLFMDARVRVVVATSFKAMSLIGDSQFQALLLQDKAPFTTIVIDEAGLLSRIAVAALSLLCARRVLLVGDSRQLAPISRISRTLPLRQQQWLASSALNHLRDIENLPPAVHILREQRRMHPQVCKLVSNYQYDGFLTTASDTYARESVLAAEHANWSRAIWYVLDEEDISLAQLRAARGRGGRSWQRPVTPLLLEKLFADPQIMRARGLFITPFRAQAIAIADLFASWGVSNWEASTVHRQQGSESDMVIFDTVNAGSTQWPPEEWRRLINVALSRAREAVIVMASRAEMTEPYLAPLTQLLRASVLVANDRGGYCWREVSSSAEIVTATNHRELGVEPLRMGEQFARRKQLLPVLSQEQQRLSNLALDGKPRLVRGVAGSGKSLVLSHWLARVVLRHQQSLNQSSDGNNDADSFCVWAVYANRSLRKLLSDSIESAWRSHNERQLFDNGPFPWQNVRLLHVREVLADLLQATGLAINDFGYEYDRAALECLAWFQAHPTASRCDALFIDEAQDMGPATLKLLLTLVEPSTAGEKNSRAAHIFYDNAQNIYSRGTPQWSDFGIDLRGRSTIMKESFRSTRPVMEFAINVAHCLQPAIDREQRELVSLGLLKLHSVFDGDWLQVCFTEVEGPQPLYREYSCRDIQLDAVATHLKYLITVECISAQDICVLYNGQRLAEKIQQKLLPVMADIGVELSLQKNCAFERKPNTLLLTTAHSFKGYDAEVVVIPCVDGFITRDDQILTNALYVALTRARSLLAVYSLQKSSESGASSLTRLNAALRRCHHLLHLGTGDVASSDTDDRQDILSLIGSEHHRWLETIWRDYTVDQEPLFSDEGEILAQPLFHFRCGETTYLCFALGMNLPMAHLDLVDSPRYQILPAGAALPKPSNQ